MILIDRHRRAPMAARLKPDSPLSRRIVSAFFDFLDSVEHASSADEEAVEVARECLTEAFKIDRSTTTTVDRQRRRPDLLATIFASLEAYEQQQEDTGSAQQRSSSVGFDTPSVAEKSPASPVELGEDSARESSASGLSKDDLCARFFAAVEKIHFFKMNADDSHLTDRLTRYFDDALADMENGAKAYNLTNLAESLKSRGNKALQAKLYNVAIELYSCAIALCDKNAVYYCNRAAAFSHIERHSDAIKDCLQSIEIDPAYSKAYNRLGTAYYAQGNYAAAISEGFKKALQLDPNNESLKDNIKVAKQKLNEAKRAQHNQYESTASFGCDFSDSQGSTSIPFNISGFPTDFASMFSNMAGNINQNAGRDGQDQTSNGTGFSFPDINLNVGNIDGQNPEELMRSVMNIFSSGGSQQGTPPPQQGTGQSNPNSSN